MSEYPEGRTPLTWQDMPFADKPKGHPSTFEQECKQLRGHISAALDCLNSSKFTNAEQARAKELLVAALRTRTGPL